MVVKNSSSDFGATGPREGMVTFTATERAHVEAVVLMEGGALGGGIGTSNVPVNAKGLVVGGGETETRIAFCPGNLTVSEFGGSTGFKVEENGVPPLRADEADGSGGRLATA